MTGSTSETTTGYTYCRICSARCGVAVSVAQNRVRKIAPDKENPYSWHDFCIKGRTAAEILEHPFRVLEPQRRSADGYATATWTEAIDDISARVTALIEQYGPDSVAMYTGNPSGSSPALLYGRAFMAAIGSGNSYDVGSVDQNAVTVATEHMYGVKTLALIPDVDHCEYILLVGANPAESTMGWIGVVPDGWRRTLRAQERGARVVVVDPRRTPTAERADRHVAVLPGTDWAMLLALVKIILDEGREDAAACRRLSGMERLRELIASVSIPDLAARCDVPVQVLTEIALDFAGAPTAMCMSNTGTGLSEGATMAQWLSFAINDITGRTDARGGRFVGPHQLLFTSARDTEAFSAAKDPSSAPQLHRSRLRNLPPIAGCHSLAELPDEINTPGWGQVRALFVVAGNPVVSGADGAAMTAALENLDLLVGIDMFQRRSHRRADWLLPVTHWLEREDFSPMAAGQYVQLGTRMVEPPGGVREEWEIFVALAVAMDLPLFGNQNFAATVRSRQAEADEANDPGIRFSPRDAWATALERAGLFTLEDLRANPHGLPYEAELYGRLSEVLRTADGRVDVAPQVFVDDAYRQLDAASGHSTAYPLLLTSRRHKELMNSWLNESPPIHSRMATNSLEISEVDAKRLGISDGMSVVIESSVAAVTTFARISDAPRPGVVICEHGWGSELLDPTGVNGEIRYGVNRNLVVDSTILDPLSQVPRLNGQAVRVYPTPTPTPTPDADADADADAVT